jgi:HEAT repeat protein
MLAAVLLLLLSMGALVSTRLAYGHEQDVQKLNRFVQASRSDTPAMKVFREGRDFIEAENWQRAAERFQGYVREFPKDRDVDAALYWYAYALQKLGRKDDAAAPLLRLVRDFPNSSWRREAEAMLVVLGRGEAVQEALNQNNCEIKILALQSLFQANVERAIAFVSEVLKAPEGTCPGLKPAAVSLAGSHGGARVVPLLLEIAKSQGDLKLRLTAIKRLGEQNSEAVVDELLRLYDADRTSEVRAQLLRAFSESRIGRAETKLIEVARSGEDVSLRQYAIRYLGNSQSNSALEELLRIFDADKTPAIRAQILRALSERQDPRARAKLLEIARNGDTPELRVEAIRRLADGGKASLDDLLQLYASETNVAIKQGLIRAFGDIDDPRATAKLFEIARSNEPVEIRIYAIRRLGDRNDAQVLDQLISLYDAEKEMQVKVMLIRAFGDSSQKVAVQKLIAIARDSQMVELRKMAVRMLGESRDPEALKFLEDLLK